MAGGGPDFKPIIVPAIGVDTEEKPVAVGIGVGEVTEVGNEQVFSGHVCLMPIEGEFSPEHREAQDPAQPGSTSDSEGKFSRGWDPRYEDGYNQINWDRLPKN